VLQLAAIAAISKLHLSNFELKLEIPNIMLVCKFEINWSTNKNLRAFTTYLGRMDGCRCAGAMVSCAGIMVGYVGVISYVGVMVSCVGVTTSYIGVMVIID
jgi:DUF2075 family protein